MSKSEVVLSDEKPLTMTGVKGLLVKWLFGGWGIAVFSGITAGYTFTYKTNNSIEILTTSKEQTDKKITEISKDVEEIKIALNKTGVYTDTNKDEIKDIKERMSAIESKQDEMLKVLYQIKAQK